MNIVRVFLKAVASYPNQIAIKDNRRSFTYKEFEILSRNFALKLKEHKIDKNSIVGICMERSVDMLIAIFGILRAGAAYLPIDNTNPPKRILNTLQDADVQLVVTSSNLSDFIQSLGVDTIIPKVYELSKDTNQTLAEPKDNDLAYILFTSGSTGIPKGVLIEHHSVVNLISHIQDRYPIGYGDVILFKSPYTFDGSIWELFGWMLMGGTLFISPPGIEMDPKQLLNTILEEKISFLFFVPSMLKAFLDYFPDNADPISLPSLKWMSVGGEVLPTTLIHQFHRKIANEVVRLINVYGPTETTVYAITHPCEPDSSLLKTPLGLAVENDYIYLLDESKNLVEDGEEGEIYIGGEGVARGYLNNIELTEKLFLSDHIRGFGKMYKTGDIGKKNQDGTYDFIGRKDHQIKLRGQRIECGEIEHILLNTTIISECIVTVDTDHNQDMSIVAYFTTKTNNIEIAHIAPASQEIITSIKHEISEWLPSYMLPSYYVVIDKFKLTDHGKIDRNFLPKITELFQPVDNHIISTLNNTEKTIYHLWAQTIGKQPSDINEDFFFSGGHSLKAVQLISLIIKQTGFEIPLSVFFEGITIKEIAKNIDLQNYPKANFSSQDSINTDQLEALPITLNQRDIWTMNNIDQTGIEHNIQIEFSLEGAVDIEKFSNALKKTIQKEEIFRSVFVPIENIPHQFIKETVDIEIIITDLSDILNDKRQLVYTEIYQKHGRQKFSLDTLPLFAFHLIKFSDIEYKLLMNIHHIIFDGWSLYLFMDKILSNYYHRATSSSKHRNIDYVDFLNQSSVLQKKEIEKKYWGKKLSNLPHRFHIPYKKGCNFNEIGKHGNRFWWDLSEELSIKIEEYVITNKATPFVVFMSAFHLTLASISKSNDLIIGTPFANRNSQIIENLIGYYTNMLSIRLTWDEQTSLKSIINLCNTNSSEAFSHPLISFGELVSLFGNQTEIGSNPFFQAIFVLQNWPHEHNFPDEFKFTQKEIGNNTAKVELLLNTEKVDNHYTCWFEYDTMLYDELIISKLAEAFLLTLTTITSNHELTINELNSRIENTIHMNRKKCYIIGEGSLAEQCAMILSKKGFYIETFFTNTSATISNHPPISFSRKPLDCNSETFVTVDYIFSINNSIVLNDQFLQLASEKAINYHDSLLPEYAGMFATNWAIIENRKTHGVSWHEITQKIDAGDVLVSMPVEIFENDTAWTLNTRCFEAAIFCFEQLTDNILNNNINPIKQDLTKRSYYPLAKRPKDFGMLYPTMDISEANTLFRATDFGHKLNNDFMLPWININNNYYIIESAKAINSVGKPGSFSIIDKSPGFFCSNGFIVITKLYSLELEPIQLEEMFSNESYMKEPDRNTINKALSLLKTTAKHEDFIKQELIKADYISWPFNSFSAQNSNYISFNIDPFILESFINKTDYLISSISLFLQLLTDKSEGCIDFIHETQESNDSVLFNNHLPLNINPLSNATIKENIENISQRIQKLKEVHCYSRSLPLRQTELKGNTQHKSEIIITNGTNTSNFVDGKINIFVTESKISIHSKKSQTIYLDHFQETFKFFLKQAINNPDKLLSEVQLTSLDVDTFNQTHTETVIDVIELIEKSASNFPKNTAIIDQNGSYSYSQMMNDVHKVAHVINPYIQLNSTVVAISINRSYLNIVALLSILKCGGTFIQLDEHNPQQRNEYIINDSNCALIIVDETNKTTNTIPQLNISEIIQAPLTISNKINHLSLSPAYIIYTSGSSGLPKGVVVSRTNLSTFVAGAISTYQITTKDKILQFSNLTFDASIEEIFCALCCGASLILRTQEMLDPNKLIEFSINHNISIWDLPTAYWRQFIKTEAFSNQINHSAIRTVIIGGEAVYPSDIETWYAQKPKAVLINTYGPTETTVVALTYPIEDKKYHSVPIGKPLPKYNTLIVNNNLQTLPLCTQGELLIMGDGVAQSYLNREDLTNESFINISIPTIETFKCYRTGDLALKDIDGHIHYLGRKDSQIKIRGYRVEAKEIESQILKTSMADSCIVVPIQHKKTDNKLVAFCTNQLNNIDFTILKNLISTQLPDYMIPQDFFQIMEIPFTKNGKTDLKKLQEIASETTIIREKKVTHNATSDTEKMVLELWKKVLGKDSIDLHDDFFDIGGHSLKAVALMAEIKSITGENIPLASLIQHPTIKTFADYLESNSKKNQWNCLVPIRPKGTKAPLFLVHGAGLNVLLFQSLSKHLDPERPIYAFQASGLDGVKTLKIKIEEMADEYISELLKIHDKGPIYLLGFSLGGFIAFEMTAKLKAMGHQVEFTGLIDTVSFMADYSNSNTTKKIHKIWTIFVRPFYNIYLFLKEPMETKSVFIQKKINNTKLIIKYLSLKFGLTKPQININAIQASTPNIQVRFLLNDALKKYKLRKTDIHIDLFKAGKQTFFILDSNNYGWDKFAKDGITKHTIPTEHNLLFAAPNDQLFSNIIDKRLNEIEKKHG